jgi:endoglucanase
VIRSPLLPLVVAAGLFPPLRPASAAPPATETAPDNNRMIHQRGIEIVDGNNRPLKLKGVNLGNWFVWAPYAWGGPLSFSVGTSVMKERMRELVGAPETEAFVDEYVANYIREPDIARISAMGFNVVRMPIHWEMLEDNSHPFVYKASGWKILDTLLTWAERNHVYVVLDLHAAPGGQSRLYTADPDSRSQLWDSRADQDRTVALWKAMAQRYRDRAIVAGYDLLNEPALPRKTDLVDLYARIIAAIREVDPQHMVILENARFADFSAFADLSRNKAYSPHFYTWFKEGQKVLKKHAEVAERHRVPLWIGEFGEQKADKVRGNLDLFENERSVQGWAFWSWKKVNKNDTILLGIAAGDRWMRVVQVIGARWMPFLRRRPPRDEIIGAMRDFVRAVRFENNYENAQMRDVLTRAGRLPAGGAR